MGDPPGKFHGEPKGMGAVQDFKPLEDYGLIGNLETCALAGRDGSIDWFCFPSIDSPSVFAAILDPGRGGFFRVGPAGNHRAKQSYVANTNVLDTVFDLPGGSLTLTDFMPVPPQGQEHEKGAAQGIIVRKLKCTRGSCDVEVDFAPRFDYGRADAVLTKRDGGILAAGEGRKLILRSSIPLEISGPRARGAHSLREGEVRWLVLGYEDGRPQDDDALEALLDENIRYWRNWLRSSKLWRPILQGPWHDLVIRSALVLKLLTNARTGAVIAAPTTSLPESLGGIRNWDYRYCWIRDSAMTIQAFEVLGYYEEALKYFQWLKSVCYRDVEESGQLNIKIAYTFQGGDVPGEREIESLCGYKNSAPVRVGNAAFGQVQMDIYGDIVNVFYQARGYERNLIPRYWHFLRAIADHVCRTWKTKDSGIWELRTEPRALTHSKLMCWVALDRCIRMAGENHLDGNLEDWKRACSDIRTAIMERGFSRKLNSFVQSFDYEVLDSTSLLIPVTGFLPANDPRMLSTMEAVSRDLASGEFIRRYKGSDGLPGAEGAFLLCSFWLVRALAMAGRVKTAEREFLKVLKYKSPLGLLSEEIDPRSGGQIGNFPQAFSHLGLINAAMYLGKHLGREGGGPRLMGSDKDGGK